MLKIMTERYFHITISGVLIPIMVVEK